MGSWGKAAGEWLFPDVASLPAADRTRAIMASFRYRSRNPTMMMPMDRLLVWAAFVGAYAAAPFLPLWPAVRVRPIGVLILFLALIAVFAALNVHFFLTDLRGLVRIRCNRLGVHRCAACGYPLDGAALQSPAGVCAECGSAVGAGANEKRLITLMPQSRVFPELRLFKDPDDAEAALQRAFAVHPVIRRRRRGVAVVVAVLATLVVAVGMETVLSTREGELRLPRAVVALGAAATVCMAVMGWRRYCIRTIRGELIREQPK